MHILPTLKNIGAVKNQKIKIKHINILTWDKWNIVGKALKERNIFIPIN